MPGHPVGGLGVQQVGELGRQPVGRESLEEAGQPSRQQRFVQACAGSRFHGAESDRCAQYGCLRPSRAGWGAHLAISMGASDRVIYAQKWCCISNIHSIQ